jgi:hypothetical protein
VLCSTLVILAGCSNSESSRRLSILSLWYARLPRDLKMHRNMSAASLSTVSSNWLIASLKHFPSQFHSIYYSMCSRMRIRTGFAPRFSEVPPGLANLLILLCNSRLLEIKEAVSQAILRTLVLIRRPQQLTEVGARHALFVE